MEASSSNIRSSTSQATQPRTNERGDLRTEVGLNSAAMEDTVMTSPDLLRSPSQYEGRAPGIRASSLPHTCSYNPDERMTQASFPVQLATAAYNAARPYTRLSVNDFLNRPSTSSTQATTRQKSTAAKASSGNDFDHPMVTPPHSSTTRSNNSFSSISSDSTLRPPFSVGEERYYRLNSLYHICMDATSTYIRGLLPPTRHKQNQLRRYPHSRLSPSPISSPP
ncbi:hypothetical protein BKA64DRAFT_295686 [Cadophora sp. MPI-SDFR-AT-0126]|nr:hypothetical protein BKA64DRAFT_295686 [Leotiomycetes sp. MPI-SDFR-AT-0126]